MERFTSAALVCKQWHRLTNAPDLLRQGVSARIETAHLQRLQALCRWLRRHAGSLQNCLEIAVGAPPGNKAALQLELGRCVVVAVSGGSLRCLSLAWLGSKQIKLGAELAACTNCSALRQLAITSCGSGTIHMACPLARLSAVEHLSLHGACKWEAGLASLPPSITRLDLEKVSDANKSRLPPQLAALTGLDSLTLDMSSSQIDNGGYSVLTALGSLRHLTLVGCGDWPADLQRLTGLESLHLRSAGWWAAQYGDGWWAAHYGGVPAGFQATLLALTRLHTLTIKGTMTRLLDPSTALVGSSRLRWLYDGGSRGSNRNTSGQAMFCPEAWPEGLSAVLSDWPALVSSSWSPGVAQEVRYICVLPATLDARRHPQAPGWKAFWAWAARAPSLRLLEVPGYANRGLEMVLSNELSALKRRRPGLRISSKGPADTEHFLATAGAVCQPGQ